MGTDQITNTESLESILERVEALRGDLSANLKEERWHWESPHEVGEEVYEKGGFYKGSSPWTKEEYERTKERIVDEPVVPNTQKREAARTGLQQIYDSSEWYSGRYVAGSALGREELNVQHWIQDLEKMLRATEGTALIDVIVGSHTESRDVYSKISGEPGMMLTEWVEVNDYEQKNFTIINKETRQRALTDLSNLYRLSRSDAARDILLRIWNKSPDYLPGDMHVDEMHRPFQTEFKNDMLREVGTVLGCHPLRIWSKVHPIAAALTGVVAASSVFGLGYLLSSYMMR